MATFDSFSVEEEFFALFFNALGSVQHRSANVIANALQFFRFDDVFHVLCPDGAADGDDNNRNVHDSGADEAADDEQARTNIETNNAGNVDDGVGDAEARAGHAEEECDDDVAVGN